MKHRLLSKFIISCFLLAACSTLDYAQDIKKKSRVAFLGRFSNMEFTEEHAYGSWVDLWKEGKELFGHFYNSEGLAGDTPRGSIEDVQYNHQTGEFDFRAKLSMGVISWSGEGKSHREFRSRDLFIFHGKLQSDSIVGILELRDGWKPETPLQSKQQIVLKKESNEYLESLKFETRTAWENYSRDVVRKREPEW